jgi:hypothetical protein
LLFKRYTCYFYETAGAHKPVEDFIKSLDAATQDKFDFKKGLLEYFGPQLRYPHTEPISK